MLGFFGIFSGLGNKVKTIIAIILGIAIIAGSVTAIVLISLNVAKPLEKPNVTLTGNVASWDADELVGEWELHLNGEYSRVDKSTTSISLNDGDILSVRAIGGGGFLDSEWSDAVEYKISVPTYTVTWKNYDGTVIRTDSYVPAGTIPSYSGALLTKPADARYTYTFNAWTPVPSAISTDVTYTATFSSVPNNYNVEFYSDDGLTLLDTVTVTYGAAAEYTKATPQKTESISHTYSFEKWVVAPASADAADLSNVTENKKVYAAFVGTLKTYTVTVISSNAEYGAVSEDEIVGVPYGSSITVSDNALTVNGTSISATPTSSDAEYTYNFSGWTGNAESVTSDMTVTASFERVKNAYTVTWKNSDGTVLETDESVEYGSIPSYDGAVPLNPGRNAVLYDFVGWTQTVSAVSGNTDYVANYTRKDDLKLVTFYDEDGETVLAEVIVTTGADAEYKASVPVKNPSVDKTYAFDRWVTEKGGSTEASLIGVTEDKTVYASYAGSARTYTLIFKHQDGQEISTSAVNYGEASVALSFVPSLTGYTFAGWNISADGNGGSFDSVSDVDEALFSSASGNSVTLYAIFVSNKYRVSYLANKPALAGGEVILLPSSELWSYNADCTLASAPSLTGWTFGGWYKDSECTERAGSAGEVLTSPNYATYGEVPLYAKWTPKNYTVVYSANGGVGTTAPSSHIYDTSGKLTLNGFEREDHVFLGWNTDANASIPTLADGESVSTLSETDITLYAIWVKVKATLSASDTVTVMPNDERTETFDPDMDLQALALGGYTHIRITFEFKAKRTLQESENLSSIDMLVKGSVCLSAQMEFKYFYGDGWDAPFVYPEATVALYECNDGGAVTLEYSVLALSSLADDGWILGARSVTFEAVKL